MQTPESILPDDPRLTAYALDEMEPSERAAFEELLANDPAARKSVEEIRAAASALTFALENEAAPVADEVPALDPYPRPTERRAKVFAFPQFYYVTAGLAAACFALVYLANAPVPREQTGHANKVVRHEMRARGAAPTAFAAAPAAAASSEGGMVALVPAKAQVPERFFSAAESSTSTFPLRIGRESYAQVREQLLARVRPAKQTVHVAEMINAFNYTWPAPAAGEAFSTVLEETSAPWAEAHRLVRVGLKAVGASSTVAAFGAQVQVDFNPALVRAWRLIGFERDDVTAGVNGGNSGETLRNGDSVTALYEIVPTEALATTRHDRTLLDFSLSYVEPLSGEARHIARRLETDRASFARASADLKFAASVAAFGLVLRDSPQRVPVGRAEIAAWARAGAEGDAQRAEFAELVEHADRTQ